MNSSTSSASFQPERWMNSRKGSTTASRSVLGAAAVASGSRTTSVITSPGSRNSAVTMNTVDHGMRSARISASEPGTRLEIRYALT